MLPFKVFVHSDYSAFCMLVGQDLARWIRLWDLLNMQRIYVVTQLRTTPDTFHATKIFCSYCVTWGPHRHKPVLGKVALLSLLARLPWDGDHLIRMRPPLFASLHFYRVVRLNEEIYFFNVFNLMIPVAEKSCMTDLDRPSWTLFQNQR